MDDRSFELDQIIEEIRALPRTKPVACCGRGQDVSSLDIYSQCPVCGKKMKLRCFGPKGIEIQDVIDEVLAWIGTGKDLETALQRKLQIDQARGSAGAAPSSDPA